MASTSSAARTIARLDAKSTVMFCCDMQERFKTAISGFEHIAVTATKLLKAAKLLDIPVFTTEQYPKALGPTIAPLAAELSSMPPITSEAIHAKTRFSMFLPGITDKWLADAHKGDVKSVVLFGIESHVCVLQTTLDLLERGYNVHVVSDGVSSINREEVPVALSRLSQSGATLTTSESLIFELVGDASDERFKAVSALIKEEKERTREALKALGGHVGGNDGCGVM